MLTSDGEHGHPYLAQILAVSVQHLPTASATCGYGAHALHHSGGLVCCRSAKTAAACPESWEGLGIGIGFKDKYKLLSIQERESRTFQLGTRARVEFKDSKGVG